MIYIYIYFQFSLNLNNKNGKIMSTSRVFVTTFLVKKVFRHPQPGCLLWPIPWTLGASCPQQHPRWIKNVPETKIDHEKETRQAIVCWSKYRELYWIASRERQQKNTISKSWDRYLSVLVPKVNHYPKQLEFFSIPLGKSTVKSGGKLWDFVWFLPQKHSTLSNTVNQRK